MRILFLFAALCLANGLLGQAVTVQAVNLIGVDQQPPNVFETMLKYSTNNDDRRIAVSIDQLPEGVKSIKVESKDFEGKFDRQPTSLGVVDISDAKGHDIALSPAGGGRGKITYTVDAPKSISAVINLSFSICSADGLKLMTVKSQITIGPTRTE